MAKLLINDGLAEIAKEYRPGLLAWLKSHSDRWAKLLDLEDRINLAALAGDEVGLKCALSDYREFFEEMAERYGKGDDLPLFGRGERV